MIVKVVVRCGGLMLALALALAAACSGGGGTTSPRPPPPPPPPPPPVISSFTATPVSIPTGRSAILSWAVTDATSLSIDQGVGIVTGRTSVSVSPTVDTTYTLSAT